MNIKNSYIESGCIGSINELGEHTVNISNSISATVEQTHEMQLA